MIIERKYYEMSVKEKEEWDKEIAAENAKLTADEKGEKKRKMESEALEIIRKGEEQLKKIKKVPNPKKIVDFTMLEKAALDFAKLAELNITISKDEDDTYGYIELSYGISWIIEEMPESCKKTMAALYLKAKQICTCVKDNRVVQRFEFELADIRTI